MLWPPNPPPTRPTLAEITNDLNLDNSLDSLLQPLVALLRSTPLPPPAATPLHLPTLPPPSLSLPVHPPTPLLIPPPISTTPPLCSMSPHAYTPPAQHVHHPHQHPDMPCQRSVHSDSDLLALRPTILHQIGSHSTLSNGPGLGMVGGGDGVLAAAASHTDVVGVAIGGGVSVSGVSSSAATTPTNPEQQLVYCHVLHRYVCWAHVPHVC